LLGLLLALPLYFEAFILLFLRVPRSQVVTALISEILAFAATCLIMSSERKRKEAIWRRRLAIVDHILEPLLSDMSNLGTLLDISVIEPKSRDHRADPGQMVGAKGAIVRLLPRITPLEATQFNEARRQALYRFLNYRDETVVIGALSAIAAVGNDGVTNTLSQLANRTPRNPRETRIQQAARESLERLVARLEAEKLAATLLRFSAQPDEAQALLRPAGNELSNPEMLLRVTEK
jgi:hypothetical protein